MKYIKKFLQHNESKYFNYKTISDFIKEYEDFQDNYIWVFLDTETTGLGGPKKQQLTQIASIAYLNDTIIDNFNEKIKLTKNIKDRIKTEPENKWNTKGVLKFNRYGDKIGKRYIELEDAKNNFIQWIENLSVKHNKKILLVIQNSQFDMSMFDRNLKYKVLDTKDIIRLFLIPTFQKKSETDNKYKVILDEIGRSDRDSGLYNSSMSKWGPYFKLNMDKYHDAFEDCIITKKMMDKIIDILSQNEDLDILKYQHERIKNQQKYKN